MGNAYGSSGLTPGTNCFKVARADKATVIIDGDDYFRAARSAMLNARRRIMLIGWDFDSRIELGRGKDETEEETGPTKVGDFIYWLVERTPSLEVYLLRWDMDAIKTAFRGTTIFTLLKWKMHPRIVTRLDGHHPRGASHHQKIVVIDDCFAFCGGIDMTAGRWDTRAHKDNDRGRLKPDGKKHEPWHDATCAIEGKAATVLADLARDRWKKSGARTKLKPVESAGPCWPDCLEPQFKNVDIAIARSEPKMPGSSAVIEIERLFEHQIAQAKRFLYIESQYFASRKIAAAIARRLIEKGGPEIVIVNPCSADGWLEPIAMDTARARLFEALRRKDHEKRLRLYHPFTSKGVGIYVHAKILIADDQVLRVGSSNMNNRSLRLDTECDIVIDSRMPANKGSAKRIEAIRNDLLGEHLGVTPKVFAAKFAATGSLIEAIEKLRGKGKTLRPYKMPDLPDIEKWLADNEILDPEGPDQMFESFHRTGLLGGIIT